MTVTGAQLTLDLPHRPALDRADFLVAPANELAVAWIDRWPAWPHPALALQGPAGSGKTHLLRVWQKAAGARPLDPQQIATREPAALLDGARAAFLDDAGGALDAAAAARDGGAFARGLLHLYNSLAEVGGHLLLADRRAPRAWPMIVPDLHSRLGAAPVVAMGAPDDQLIAAVLVKLFADRQLSAPPEVLRFLLPRMERSFAAAQAVVAALDRAALARQRAITVPLARAVLQGESGAGAAPHIEEGEDTWISD